MGEAASQRVVVLGAGRVATHLAPALVAAGYQLVQVWSRTEASARLLAEPLGVAYTHEFSAVATDADIYIICVADGALPEVAKKIGSLTSRPLQGVGELSGDVKEPPLFLHTAGSVSMDVWREAGTTCYGILYPLQTFSRERAVNMREVSLFVEASDERAMARIEALAHRISNRVFRANSERRARLHIAAVFACNFTNAMYDAAHRLLATDDIPFDVLLPLIDETAAKVHHLTPREAQTGPAVRGDKNVMHRHMQALEGDESLQTMYELISNYIANV